MFGFGVPEIIVLSIVILAPFVLLKIVGRGPKGDNVKDALLSRSNRECLTCGYKGYMKTWISNNSVPQVIVLVLLLFYVIPGIIFIAWGWGKYKCPKCGALDKNIKLNGQPAPEPTKKKCPFCAEEILSEAIVCKHCSREVPTLS